MATLSGSLASYKMEEHINSLLYILDMSVLGQNGKDKMVYGQDGTDKMVQTRWYGQNGTDKMVWTKWYG